MVEPTGLQGETGGPRKRVLLAGATGYIGRAVAEELSSRQFDVLAPVRPQATSSPDASSDASSPPTQIEWLRTGLTDADELRRSLSGRRVDAVVSCIASRSGVPHDAWLVDFQANCNLLEVARELGVERFVLVSAICVQRPQLEFQRAKLAFESRLIESGIDYTIVRPTAFFKSLSGQIDRVANGRPFIVFGDGTETACKPISERDLARYVVDSLQDETRSHRILEIGGPGPAITPREQGELLFELLDRPAKFRSVPVGIFSAAIAAMTPLRFLDSVAAKIELARIGRFYATESMLHWDAERGRFDASATPETGTDTLRDHYARILEKGLQHHTLGAHKLFS